MKMHLSKPFLKIFLLLGSKIVFVFFLGCSPSENQKINSAEVPAPPIGSFGHDLEFLKQKDENILILKNENGEGQIIVSPKYQAKVFTSTAEGLSGKSFGWINYEAFDGQPDPHMNAYGGENRLWLGPEGGKFSVFFKPGERMQFENWKTPAAIDTEPWLASSISQKNVTLNKEAKLKNYLGTEFNLEMIRTISILENDEIEKMLDCKLPEGVQSVGYSTENVLVNKGDKEWNRSSGAPCLWVLDMFVPSPQTTIVIPYKMDVKGKVATTDYFGEILPARIKMEDGNLFFHADGKSRGKLGIGPERAKPVAGSYDALNNVLTMTKFDIDNKAIYLNQEWNVDKDPLTGDAVNAYNDGPLEDGTQMGPFYELESVSPAAFIKPGDSLKHQHSVFHFVGDKEGLNQLSERLLKISLDKIERALDND